MRFSLLLLTLSTLAFASPSRVQEECLGCSLDTTLLWPPNHNLVDVGLNLEEHGDPNATHTTTLQVFSDEDDVWPASRQFSPDASQLCDRLRLRSERGGHGDGRVYLIIVTVLDTNLTTKISHTHGCALSVVVPHDMSAASIASVRAQAQAAEEYWAAYGAAPSNYYLVGDGPMIGPKQ